MEPRLRRLLPVLLVVCAIAAAVLAARGDGLTGEVLPPPQEEIASPATQPGAGARTPVPTLPERPEVEPRQLPVWFENSVAALFIALLVGIIGLFVYAGVRYLLTERVIRRELVDQAASQPGRLASEEVRDAVRASLADIDAGGDPRRAVIACWLRLERAAAAAGTARLTADTPADLVRRLLTAHQVSGPALEQLATAYRQARYAPASVSDDLAATARAALSDIDSRLSSSPLAGVRR